MSTAAETINQTHFAKLHDRINGVADTAPTMMARCCVTARVWRHVLSTVGVPVGTGRSWVTEADRMRVCDVERALATVDAVGTAEAAPVLCAGHPCPAAHLRGERPGSGPLPCLARAA
ncbi:hypothetical protein [Aromatoleum anaerobium]|uniref:Uncharacterized protein n=1 Tax=Aromatoleum anaerobium TaxID=182180 RepID=A0ABX1PSR4_9RHOO|nr:hypothetical protein [Aromatoleum anaerobium]MCK0506333.1 hypothetical protein [Aromatoleum anaerobium]